MQADRIVLITRVGCHLCEEGRDVVRRAAETAQVSWREVDVDTDAELARRFTDMVPVVLVDDAQVDFGRLDEGRLAAALAGRRWWRRGRR